MIHIGIDISKKDFDCYSSGKINKFNQNNKGYRSFRSWIRKNFGECPLVCVMEATGVYHLALASYLVEQGIKVSVVNPLRPHYHAKANLVRVTNDASSARNIWDFAQKNQIKGGWTPMPAEIVKLRFWLKRIDLIQKERTKCTNRLKAMALQKALGKDEFTVTKQDLARWNQELEKARQKATELCEPFQEDEALFKSIPGVGKMGTMILISFFRANYQIDDAMVALILAGMSLKE